MIHTHADSRLRPTSVTRTVIAVLLMCAECTAKAAGTPDCDKDAGGCVRWAIVEVATCVEVCGKLLPDFRDRLDAAYARWRVLKLPLPGLGAAPRPAPAQVDSKRS